ncbi:hypothetical protein [Priestia koreensis]|uniref:hypothetical protein n=1 Tax=Priestia koreensis TaxID=284581 RepID=UPI0028F6DEBC|nr:hypothetical protein [Priestia koreensis]
MESDRLSFSYHHHFCICYRQVTPDGNKLEFIPMLEGKPRDLDYVPYLSEWNKLSHS